MGIKYFKADLLPFVRKLDINTRRNNLTSLLSGNLNSVRKGQGIEFASFRQYTPGDDAMRIDWRASLRTGKILVRELEIEKNINVYFLLDVGESMLFSSEEKLKAEYAAELVSAMTYALLQNGETVGLTMFSDGIKRHLPPMLGKDQYSRVNEELVNGDIYGGPVDFENTMKKFMSIVKSRGVLIMVSDFLGLDADWMRYLSIINQSFEIVALVVRDKRDRELPRGVGEYMLEDPQTGDKIVVDVNKYADLYKRYVMEEEQRIQGFFSSLRANCLILPTGGNSANAISRFFEQRRKMIDH